MNQTEEKTITLLNFRKHSFKTSRGEFKTGVENGMAFGAEEANTLLGYEGVVDASKYTPAGNEDLQAKVADLEAKLAASGGPELENAIARITELENENGELRKKLDAGVDPAAADRVKELEEENSKLQKKIDRLETKVEKLKD